MSLDLQTSAGRRRGICRALALALVLVGTSLGIAAAQEWLDIYKTPQPAGRQTEGRASMPQANGPAPAYADPGRGSADPMEFFRSQGQRPPTVQYGHGGGSAGYCVRLCDGRYFPIQRAGGASPETMCGAFCPASKTKVYYGSSIDHARASDGKRYEDLTTAYEYRERIVPDCTCNGKDAGGLVTLDVASDPTLRPGDIVATKDGLMSYRMVRSRRGTETANFTPVDQSDLPRSRRVR